MFRRMTRGPIQTATRARRRFGISGITAIFLASVATAGVAGASTGAFQTPAAATVASTTTAGASPTMSVSHPAPASKVGVPLSVSCPATHICYALAGTRQYGSVLGAYLLKTTGGGNWTVLTVPGGSTNVNGTLSCPTADECFLGTESWAPPRRPEDVVLVTHDGGRDWTTAAFPKANQGLQVTCLTSSHCVGVDLEGLWVATTDSGATWTQSHSPGGDTPPSCPSESVCYLINEVGHVYRTVNAGRSWRQAGRPIPNGSGLDCPTASTCYAAGYTSGGPNVTDVAIATTHNAGATWTSREPPEGLGDGLFGISCWTTSACVTVGKNLGGGVLPGQVSGANIYGTSNGGSSWTLQPSPGPTFALTAISCPAAGHCVAVGTGRRLTPSLIRTGDGGSRWVTQRIS